MADNNKDDPIGDAIGIFALIVFGPLFAAVIIGGVLRALAPAIPFLLVAAVVGAVGFGFYAYRNSALTIRRRHEREVLELLARAEAQQQALPLKLAEGDLTAALGAARGARRRRGNRGADAGGPGDLRRRVLAGAAADAGGAAGGRAGLRCRL
jgi:hypothetical protein